MASTDDPKSSEVDNSNSNEEHPRSQSNASEYAYKMPIERLESWDKYLTTKDVFVPASEKHTDFFKKASVLLKLATIFVTFVVVLGAGIIAKGALLFILAQVRIINSTWVKDCFNSTLLIIDFNKLETV